MQEKHVLLSSLIHPQRIFPPSSKIKRAYECVLHSMFWIGNSFPLGRDLPPYSLIYLGGKEIIMYMLARP